MSIAAYSGTGRGGYEDCSPPHTASAPPHTASAPPRGGLWTNILYMSFDSKPISNTVYTLEVGEQPLQPLLQPHSAASVAPPRGERLNMY